MVSAPDLRAGLSSLLQLTGLGGLRPNTCVLAWPDARRLSSERALRFLEFIARAAVNEKAVLALKTWGPRFQPFPASNHVLHGHPLVRRVGAMHGAWRPSLRPFRFVRGVACRGRDADPIDASTTPLPNMQDVWWLLHDGGILILVAYLLKRHATWRHCSLRIFTVVQVGGLRTRTAAMFGVRRVCLSVFLRLMAWLTHAQTQP